MKILYVSQYFPPEMGAPAARASELAFHWTRMGHEVTVLTGFPNHPTGEIHPSYRGKLRRLVLHETVDGIDVVRTWLLPFANRGSVRRMANYASFCISAALTGSFLARHDVVIGSSPQLLVGLSAWWIGRKKQAPFVFEVRDLWPESLAAVGMGKPGSLFHRLLGKIAGFLYRECQRVVVVTPAFKSHLIEHWQVPAEKISVAGNGVETELFCPGPPDSDLRQQLQLDGKFIVGYIGTMGMAHGLETLLQAASQLKVSAPNVSFLLVGEGAEKDRIQAASSALRNVKVLGQQPRERIPEYIRACDVCLVLLKKTELFKTVIPTKMLEFMSCARPVIVAVDGEARSIIERNGAGLYVEPENVEALCQAITHLANDAGLRNELGKNGRNAIVQNYSRSQTAHHYAQDMENMLHPRKQERAAVVSSAS